MTEQTTLAFETAEKAPATEKASSVDLRAKRIQQKAGVARQAVSEAKEMFPTNVHQRLLHYTRVATLNAGPNDNPRNFVLNVVGHAGLGKTALVREYAKKMGIGFRNINVGGITDIADLIGMHKPVTQLLKKKDGTTVEVQRTVLALPQWFPDIEKEPAGIILFDDFNRGLAHVLQGVMQLIIDGYFNELEVPHGWTMVCTSNPDGDEYNVTSLDGAQLTRTVTVAYNRPTERFYEQLTAQDVDNDMSNFWVRYPEMVNTEKKFSMDAAVITSVMNDRLRMIWNHLYPFLKLDQDAMYEVGMSLFGSDFMSNLESYLQSEQPIEPMAILNDYAKVRGKVKDHAESHRSDLVGVSVQRLAHFANDPNVTLTEDQVDNIARYLIDLKNFDCKEFSFNLAYRLIARGAPKQSFYANKLAKFNQSGKENGEVNAIIRDMIGVLQTND